MTSTEAWAAYPPTYRAQELQTLAAWIATGQSSSVVGLVGCGRSSLLDFLCHRPDALQRYLPKAERVVLLQVDIYNLPTNDLASLCRTILHSFYWERERFAGTLAQSVTELYLENRALIDPFLPQKALYELILLFQKERLQVVLVLNRFDRFCATATLQMVNNLRGLRDNFKNTLSYIVGMQQEALYLGDPAMLGDMYELLDSHVCLVGRLSESDAYSQLLHVLRATATPPTLEEVADLLQLSGNFPSLLKAVGQWWLMNPQRPTTLAAWCEQLLTESSIEYRLDRIWNGLTQEEKLALAEVQKLQLRTGTRRTGSGRIGKEAPASAGEEAEQTRLLERLAAKGLCTCVDKHWQINGILLNAYIARFEGRVPGKIWLDEQTHMIYQGQQPIEELTGLQYEILCFLVKNPRVRHTRDDIIDNGWPDVDQREGITPNALQVHIAAIRKRIEPRPSAPRYLLTWHGRPGGYQFFPEGKPEPE